MAGVFDRWFLVFQSFGQHGRELITSEVAFRLLSILSEEKPTPNLDPATLNSTLDKIIIKVRVLLKSMDAAADLLTMGGVNCPHSANLITCYSPLSFFLLPTSHKKLFCFSSSVVFQFCVPYLIFWMRRCWELCCLMIWRWFQWKTWMAVNLLKQEIYVRGEMVMVFILMILKEILKLFEVIKMLKFLPCNREGSWSQQKLERRLGQKGKGTLCLNNSPLVYELFTLKKTFRPSPITGLWSIWGVSWNCSIQWAWNPNYAETCHIIWSTHMG